MRSLNSISSSSIVAIILLSNTALAAVSTIILTSSPTPTPASPSFTNDKTFENDILNATNFYREQHNASVLVWNDTSARFAANWSEACVFKHSGGPTGENLVAGFPNVSASVDTWGLERESYDWKKPGFSEATGHFTQLVWRNTTSVGCGRMNCTGENGTPGWYVVCEYYPQGNIVGDDNQYFKDNVLAQTEGKASDTVESGTTSAGCGFGEMRWGACVLGLAALLGAGIAW